jgi:hypothetical protein
VIESPSREEGQKWATKWSTASRSVHEVWGLGYDPEIDALLSEAVNRRSHPTDAPPGRCLDLEGCHERMLRRDSAETSSVVRPLGIWLCL